MSDPPGIDAVDPVAALIRRANRFIDGSPEFNEVNELIASMAALAPRDLARLDLQSRSWLSGVDWPAVKRLRWPALRGARRNLWQVLALMAADGHEREKAVARCPLAVPYVQLLLLRCLDWVGPVRDAALERLDEIPSDLLLEVLPLAVTLAAERRRGPILDAFIDARLDDSHLRLAGRSESVLVRRAAWMRLKTRGHLAPTDFELLVVDSDVMVRRIAVQALQQLPEAERISAARRLLKDPVGSIGATALAQLVDLDGPNTILEALMASLAPVRRSARDWASLRGIEARPVYLSRLQRAPNDLIGLTGLAEIGNAADSDLFERMTEDPRSRVVAAGLGALSRVNAASARGIALRLLRERPSGRVSRTAAEVLRASTPSPAEAEALAVLALDETLSDGQRLRALALLRPLRWLHLVTVLETMGTTHSGPLSEQLEREVDDWLRRSGRIGRRPNAGLMKRLEPALIALDAARRDQIHFVLRTAVG